jgi:hypothetical protein
LNRKTRLEQKLMRAAWNGREGPGADHDLCAQHRLIDRATNVSAPRHNMRSRVDACETRILFARRWIAWISSARSRAELKV